MAEGAKFFLISADFELKRLAEFSPDRLNKVGGNARNVRRENYQFPFSFPPDHQDWFPENVISVRQGRVEYKDFISFYLYFLSFIFAF